MSRGRTGLLLMTPAQLGPNTTRRLVLGLGTAQLTVWGTLFYSFAVLGPKVRVELGLSEPALYAGFSGSLALAACLAPAVGKLIDRTGGRRVLATSTVAACLGFVVLASSRGPWSVGLALALLGVAMATGLYDACFAAIGQANPRAYRRTVAGVTLLAGFASTVFWPLTHVLVTHVGWRQASLVFAALPLVICLPLYLHLLPPTGRRMDTTVRSGAPEPPLSPRALLLALAFAGGTFVSSTLSVHWVSVLNALAFVPTTAVSIASATGVVQVLARVVELGFAGRLRPHTLALLVLAGLAASVFALLASGDAPWLVVVFVLGYGASHGLLSVAKALIAVEELGTEHVGSSLGRFSALSLGARALAPLAFALGAASGLGTLGTMATVGCLALVALGVYAGTLRFVGAQSFRAEA